MNAPQAPRDGSWIGEAVDRYEGSLLRYAIHLLGDAERGRDVVQDTFLQLCRQDRAAIDGHLAAWLFTVCRHRALDVRRKESRMNSVSPRHVETQESREPPQNEATEHKDSVRHILDLLDRLPRNQQEVVRLKFENGLSYREISQVTQLSVSNVGYLLHVALGRLRRELGVDRTG